jgi:hypothetical protein
MDFTRENVSGLRSVLHQVDAITFDDATHTADPARN